MVDQPTTSLPSHLFDLLDALRHALADHVDAMLLHVLANLVGHLLVKTSQQDAPHLLRQCY